MHFFVLMQFCNMLTTRHMLTWMLIRLLYVTYSFLAHSAHAHVPAIHCGRWQWKMAEFTHG